MDAVYMSILDPSLLYRPKLGNQVTAVKDKALFRQYTIEKTDPIQERVRQTYLQMHTNQTVNFVQNKTEYWTKFDKAEMTIMEALEKLNTLVDESDPDVDVPNIVHAFQTAERIRQAYPDQDWFHLTGLIHDLGKVMALIGEHQWAVVGDTFPVGCAFADSIVYRQTSFDRNPDLHNSKYNTKYGIYPENCGLKNVTMSWGHDEYLYRVLNHHIATSLPPVSLYIIRYHSFYPWHTDNDYLYLCDNQDMEMLPWVRAFNNFDLYTKSDDLPDIDRLRPYYESLVDKYVPGVLRW